jgi:hypothetical protein
VDQLGDKSIYESSQVDGQGDRPEIPRLKWLTRKVERSINRRSIEVRVATD